MDVIPLSCVLFLACAADLNTLVSWETSVLTALKITQWCWQKQTHYTGMRFLRIHSPCRTDILNLGFDKAAGWVLFSTPRTLCYTHTHMHTHTHTPRHKWPHAWPVYLQQWGRAADQVWFDLNTNTKSPTPQITHKEVENTQLWDSRSESSYLFVEISEAPSIHSLCSIKFPAPPWGPKVRWHKQSVRHQPSSFDACLSSWP